MSTRTSISFLASLLIGQLATSCADLDDATRAVELDVTVSYEDASIAAGNTLSGITVSLTSGTQTATAETDAQGVAHFSGLTPDVYDLSTSWTVSATEYYALTGLQAQRGDTAGGSMLQQNVFADGALTLPVRLSVSGDMVIGKVYYAGSKEKRNYAAGKFIELYNQTDEEIDVSGLYIGLVESESTPAFTLENLTAAYADSVVILKQIFRIPAETPHIVEPGGTVLIVNSAVDHRENGPLEHDLSGADFEAKWPSGNVVNNPDVAALDAVYLAISSLPYMNLVQSGPCSVVIFRTDEDIEAITRTYAYGKGSGTQFAVLPKRTIIDGVEILRNKTTGIDVSTKRLGADIDAGYTYINSASGWNGEVVVRRTLKVDSQGKAILADTNNSSADFEIRSSADIRVYPLSE